MPKLTSWLQAVDFEYLHAYRGWELADSNFNVGGKIDVILGADVCKHIIMNEVKKGPLLAQKNLFGLDTFRRIGELEA